MANYFKNLLKYAFVSKSLKVKYVFVDVFVVLTLNVISKNMTYPFQKYDWQKAITRILG